jgi:hypothetical protein
MVVASMMIGATTGAATTEGAAAATHGDAAAIAIGGMIGGTGVTIGATIDGMIGATGVMIAGIVPAGGVRRTPACHCQQVSAASAFRNLPSAGTHSPSAS